MASNELTLREVCLAEAYEESELRLKARIKELEKALKPFAAIKPSTSYAEDGSECERYSVQLPSAALGMQSDFTGADLAAARKALGSSQSGGRYNPSKATRKQTSPATGEI